MVKQTKRFKKGGMAKKVLSAILAASMVMTSSCLAFAAPVEEPVAVVEEDAATVGTEPAPVEEESETEDLQGRSRDFGQYQESVTVDSAVYNGKEQKPAVRLTNVYGDPLTEGEHYQVKYMNNINAASKDDEVHPYVHITFIGDYSDVNSKDVAFDIMPLTLTEQNTSCIADSEEFVYNGKVQYPTLTVTVTTDDGEEIVLGEKDYEIVTEDQHLTNANENGIQVTIKGVGNYAGEVNSTPAYKIHKAEFSKENISYEFERPLVYGVDDNQGSLKRLLKVYDNLSGEVLDVDQECKISLLDETPFYVGTHEFTIEATENTKNFKKGDVIKGTYEVVADATLQIVLNEAVAAGAIKQEYVYNKDQNVYPLVVEEIKKAFDNMGFEDEYVIETEEAEWRNQGVYEIKLSGRNAYAGDTASVVINIVEKALTEDGENPVSGVTASAIRGKHQGGANAPIAITVMDGDKTLEDGVDYTWEEKTETVGDKEKAYVEIIGLGNYTTEWEKGDVLRVDVVDSEKLSLNAKCITATIPDQKWTGKEIKISADDIRVVEKDGASTYTLVPDDDYWVTKVEGTEKVGVAKATIEGKGHYEGQLVVEFNIIGEEFSKAFNATMQDQFQLDEDANDIYNEVLETVVVRKNGSTGTYTNANIEIYKGDEKVEKINEVGTYVVKISDKATNSKYSGTIDLEFTVVGADVTDVVKVAAIEDQDYTGKAIEPALTLTYEEETLKAGEDYDVAYEDNVNVGVAKTVITLKGDYSGTIVRTFKINKVAQTLTLDARQEGKNGLLNRTTGDKNCTMRLTLGVEDELAKYTFESSNPDVATVTKNKDGKGVISYQSVGTAVIKVTVTSPNTETVERGYTVNVNALGKSSFTPTVTSRTPAKSFTVTSNTVKGAEGWQVRFSRYENMKSATTKNFYGVGKKLSRQTLTAMWPNMKYYVQVRPYYTDADGEKVFAKNWSAIKTIVSAATK